MDRDPDAFFAEFGRRVRRRRHILQLTQRDVADRISMNRSQFNLLEKGGRYHSMQLMQLAALADVLQTSLDYLLLRTNEDPGPVPDRVWEAEEASFAGTTPLPITTP